MSANISDNNKPVEKVALEVQDIYMNPGLAAAFQAHVEKEFSSENFDFFMEVDKLRKQANQSFSNENKKKIIQELKNIKEKFILDGAKKQINIKAEIRNEFEQFINEITQEGFDLNRFNKHTLFERMFKIEHAMIHLVSNDTFRRFQTSPIFKENGNDRKIYQEVQANKFNTPFGYFKSLGVKQGKGLTGEELKKVFEDAGPSRVMDKLPREQLGKNGQQLLQENMFELLKPPLTDKVLKHTNEIFSKLNQDLTSDPYWDYFWDHIDLTDDEKEKYKSDILNAYRFKMIGLAFQQFTPTVETLTFVQNLLNPAFKEQPNDLRKMYEVIYQKIIDNFRFDPNDHVLLHQQGKENVMKVAASLPMAIKKLEVMITNPEYMKEVKDYFIQTKKNYYSFLPSKEQAKLLNNAMGEACLDVCRELLKTHDRKEILSMMEKNKLLKPFVPYVMRRLPLKLSVSSRDSAAFVPSTVSLNTLSDIATGARDASRNLRCLDEQGKDVVFTLERGPRAGMQVTLGKSQTISSEEYIECVYKYCVGKKLSEFSQKDHEILKVLIDTVDEKNRKTTAALIDELKPDPVQTQAIHAVCQFNQGRATVAMNFIENSMALHQADASGAVKIFNPNGYKFKENAELYFQKRKGKITFNYHSTGKGFHVFDSSPNREQNYLLFNRREAVYQIVAVNDDFVRSIPLKEYEDFENTLTITLENDLNGKLQEQYDLDYTLPPLSALQYKLDYNPQISPVLYSNEITKCLALMKNRMSEETQVNTAWIKILNQQITGERQYSAIVDELGPKYAEYITKKYGEFFNHFKPYEVEPKSQPGVNDKIRQANKLLNVLTMPVGKYTGKLHSNKITRLKQFEKAVLELDQVLSVEKKLRSDVGAELKDRMERVRDMTDADLKREDLGEKFKQDQLMQVEYLQDVVKRSKIVPSASLGFVTTIREGLMNLFFRSKKDISTQISSFDPERALNNFKNEINAWSSASLKYYEDLGLVNLPAGKTFKERFGKFVDTLKNKLKETGRFTFEIEDPRTKLKSKITHSVNKQTKDALMTINNATDKAIITGLEMSKDYPFVMDPNPGMVLKVLEAALRAGYSKEKMQMIISDADKKMLEEDTAHPEKWQYFQALMSISLEDFVKQMVKYENEQREAYEKPGDKLKDVNRPPYKSRELGEPFPLELEARAVFKPK